MNHRITSVRDLGLLIRATRKVQHVRMDDISGASPVFVREVERGKETAQIGRVLVLLRELGIHLYADVPDEADETVEQLRKVGVKPLAPRRRPKPVP
jgi:hypothetical protein